MAESISDENRLSARFQYVFDKVLNSNQITGATV